MRYRPESVLGRRSLWTELIGYACRTGRRGRAFRAAVQATLERPPIGCNGDAKPSACKTRQVPWTGSVPRASPCLVANLEADFREDTCRTSSWTLGRSPGGCAPRLSLFRKPLKIFRGASAISRCAERCSCFCTPREEGCGSRSSFRIPRPRHSSYRASSRRGTVWVSTDG